MADEKMANTMKRLWAEADKVPVEQKKKWMMDHISKDFGHILPTTLLEILMAYAFNGDCGNSMNTKPDWLDMKKFCRGQKFALSNRIGILYNEILSLFMLYSFENILKVMISTGNSNTPYACFKRYLSTEARVCNWYQNDVWSPNDPGYKGIQVVRKIHTLIRKNLKTTSDEELESKMKIENPWCPALNINRLDFQLTCPLPAPDQCPYKYSNIRHMGLNQGEMISIQSFYVSLILLKPEKFGFHDATDEDLEGFCHVWRGFGYLLGIDDDFNFCRGTLEDVKTRSRDYIEFWVKPNLRCIKPEWEHVMRCVVESTQYFLPGLTYEICLYDFTQMLNLDIPRMYNTLSYTSWIKYNFIRLYFNYVSRYSIISKYLNKLLSKLLEGVKQFDKEKHKELQEKSSNTINSVVEDR